MILYIKLNGRWLPLTFSNFLTYFIYYLARIGNKKTNWHYRNWGLSRRTFFGFLCRMSLVKPFASTCHCEMFRRRYFVTIWCFSRRNTCRHERCPFRNDMSLQNVRCHKFSEKLKKNIHHVASTCRWEW
jgi:hypothetical protein